MSNRLGSVASRIAYASRKGLSGRSRGTDKLGAVDLTNKVALITGGRRIGAVVAMELARRGADVALVYRASKTEAEETAVGLRALSRRAFLVQAALQDPD